jgi:hypothetical protein
MIRLLKFFAVAALSAGCMEGAITLAAHKIAKEITGAEITALATNGYTSTAGNTIIVWTVTYSGQSPIGSVTDSAGDAFVAGTVNRGTWYGQFYYAKNVKGDSFNVVTIHPATTGRATMIYPAMMVLEYSGVDKNSPIAAEALGTNGSLNGVWTSKAFDAPAGSAVVLGIVTGNGGAFPAPQGYKIEDQYLTPNSAKFSAAVMDQVFPAAQTGITASVTWTGTLQATGAAIALKPAS